jgi:hypothetical protein
MAMVALNHIGDFVTRISRTTQSGFIVRGVTWLSEGICGSDSGCFLAVLRYVVGSLGQERKAHISCPYCGNEPVRFHLLAYFEFSNERHLVVAKPLEK